MNSIDGAKRVSKYDEMSAPRTVSRADIIEKGIDAFLETVSPIAAEMQRQAVEHMANTLRRVTKETGNVVDAHGQPITFERYLEMFEKVWIEFDEQGNPYPHTIVAGPQVVSKLEHAKKEWEKDPEKNRRFGELMDRKRQEWRDRESHRKLVD